MSDSWQPVPDPFGSLEPPGRNPPTAVGVATPPPPRGKPSSFNRHVLRRRRLASAFVGTALTASATFLVVAGSLWTAFAGAGLGSVGAFYLYRSFRPSAWWYQHAFTLSAIGRRLTRARRRAA
jgi:hypothetical protein